MSKIVSRFRHWQHDEPQARFECPPVCEGNSNWLSPHRTTAQFELFNCFHKQFGAYRELNTLIEGQVRITPVSYTHLDVYKRQMYVVNNLMIRKPKHKMLTD